MTKIEWATLGLPNGVTWNPIRARNAKTGKRGWHCEKVSPACENCYADRLNAKAGDTGGTGLPYKPGHRQNGDTEIYLDEKTLLQPLSWRAPRGVFVCSMTDIFGDWVKDEWLDRIFAVMALCPQHRFAVLTKRPKRMRSYLDGYAAHVRIERLLNEMKPSDLWNGNVANASAIFGSGRPLPNIWLGVTAEDQQRAGERREPMRALAAMGWRIFVSYEPALGPTDWTGWEFVSQIIVGGESGPEQRIMPLWWADDTLTYCRSHGISFFAKQLHIDGKLRKEIVYFPADLQIREFPHAD